MTGRRARGRRHHSGAGEEGGGGEAGSGPHRQNGDEGHERGAQRISCRDARRRPRCSGGESAEPARPMTMMRANPRHGLLGDTVKTTRSASAAPPAKITAAEPTGTSKGSRVHHELGPRRTDAPGDRGAPAGRRPDRRSSPARGPPRRPDPSAPRHRCAPSRSCRVTAESTPSAAGSEARASGDASSKRSSTSGGSPSSYQPFRPWAMVPIAGQAPQEDAGATAATARNSTRRPAIPHAEPSGNLAEAHRERGDRVPDPSRSLTTSTCPDARRRPTEACRTSSASCVAMMSAVPRERCGSRMRSMTCSADPSSRAPSTVRSADSPLPGTPRRTNRLPGSRRARDPVGHRHRPVGDGWLFVSPPRLDHRLRSRIDRSVLRARPHRSPRSRTRRGIGGNDRPLPDPESGSRAVPAVPLTMGGPAPWGA